MTTLYLEVASAGGIASSAADTKAIRVATICSRGFPVLVVSAPWAGRRSIPHLAYVAVEAKDRKGRARSPNGPDLLVP